MRIYFALKYVYSNVFPDGENYILLECRLDRGTIVHALQCVYCL